MKTRLLALTMILTVASLATAESPPNTGEALKAIRLLPEYATTTDGTIWNRFVNGTGTEKWRISTLPAGVFSDTGHGLGSLVRIHNAPLTNPALPRAILRDSSGRHWASIVTTTGASCFRRYSSLPNTVAPMTDPGLRLYTRSGDASQATFTRSSSGWYTNPAGVLVSAVSNVPRSPNFVNVSTATGWQYQNKGLLLGGSRTNVLLRSSEFGTSPWSGSVTVTADAATAPDGLTTADRLSTTNATFTRYQTYAGDPLGKTYSFSVWLWADTPHNATITLKSSVGGDSTAVTVYVTGVRKRYFVTRAFTTSGGTSTICTIAPDTGGSLPVYAWGAQLEEGQYASSYIPTTSAATTRSADSCTFPTAGNITGAQGSIFFEASLHGNQSGSSERGVITLSAADKPLYIEGGYIKAFDGTNTASLGYTFIPDKTYRLAVTWGGSSMTLYSLTDGASQSAAYAGTFGTGGPSIKIGDAGFISIKKLQFFDHAITQTELDQL